jgi:3-oxoacyl-[acyl-carrier protein] reductase
MDYGIAGKRALVLGGSRGLGAASARALADEGVEVWVAARSAEAGTPGEGITALPLDLADPASIAALVARLAAEGNIDILVNNSGGPAPGPAQGQAGAGWAAAFASMAQSIFAITDAVLPGMLARGWGRIITIGSSGVVQPIAGLALSNGVRGAVAGWSKTLAGEVAAKGVTVNMVLPGRIDTDRVRQIDAGKAKSTGASVEAVQNASLAEIPAGRYGRPEEFAAAVAFLASRQASYITGSMLRVDGGMIRGF